ncbi:MAG TPA: ribbon-helix-helix domain-containing protein [Dehalococcoidia bacterium]|nr:ribbon-helix-helix domain-containing protein [Dehalococcoidia bacterium]
MLKQNIRTTVTLPEQLLKAVDEAVETGRAKSRNQLIANAVRHELAALKRLEIDEAFEGMSADQEFYQEARKLSNEFGDSDWEAFQQSE